MIIQYNVGANFVLFVTNWLRNSGKMKGYPYDIWTIRIWTVTFPGDIWVIEIWTVKTGLGAGLRLGLGFGLVMTVQIKTGNHGTADPTFCPCLLSSNGWTD